MTEFVAPPKTCSQPEAAAIPPHWDFRERAPGRVVKLIRRHWEVGVHRGEGIAIVFGEDDRNARLVAAAPDHALFAAATCLGVAWWTPFGSDGRGEVCVGGLRYASTLDEFGCPRLEYMPLRTALVEMVTAERAAIAARRAVGPMSQAQPQ